MGNLNIGSKLNCWDFICWNRRECLRYILGNNNLKLMSGDSTFLSSHMLVPIHKNICKNLPFSKFIDNTHRYILAFIRIQWNKPLLGLIRLSSFLPCFKVRTMRSLVCIPYFVLTPFLIYEPSALPCIYCLLSVIVALFFSCYCSLRALSILFVGYFSQLSIFNHVLL